MAPFAAKVSFAFADTKNFMKLSAVVLMTPIFLIPGTIIATLGVWIGQIYMAAQLSVKREMSNAKAPVVGQ